MVNQINGSASREVSLLVDYLSRLVRNIDRDLPTNRLVQIIFTNAAWIVFAIWQLVTRVLWLIRSYRNGVVFNLNRNRWNTVRPSNNCLWNILSFNNLPVNRSLWVDVDSVASLTSQVSV